MLQIVNMLRLLKRWKMNSRWEICVVQFFDYNKNGKIKVDNDSINIYNSTYII